MPEYTYLCPKCAVEKTQTHSIHVEMVTRCPKCKTRMVKLIGGGLPPIIRGTQTPYRGK